MSNPKDCSFNSFEFLFWQLCHTFEANIRAIYTTLPLKMSFLVPAIATCQKSFSLYRKNQICMKTVLKEATRLVEKGGLAINRPIGRSVLFDVQYLSSSMLEFPWFSDQFSLFQEIFVIFSRPIYLFATPF